MDECAHRGGEPAGAGDLKSLMALAAAHRRAGRLPAAEELYAKIIAAWPTAAEPRRRLGILCAESGRGDEAIAHLAAAQRLVPDNPAYLTDLGHAYFAADRLAEAADAYRQALALRPDFAAAHFSLGNLLRREGKLLEAAAAYRRAIAAHAGIAGFHVNLGVTLHELSHFDEAIAVLRQAVALDVRSVEVHYNLAVVLAAQRRLDEAIQSYRTALAIDPRSASLYLNLGAALQEQDKRDEAKLCFARAVELDPNLAQPHLNLGAVLYEEGAFDAALAEIRKGLLLAPGHAVSYVNLAQTFQAMGDFPAAETAFRKALELEPTLTAAKAHWSTALQQLGKWGEALTLLDYEHLLKQRRLARVPAWATVADFNAELARYICRHPTLMRDPPGRATQHGSQTMELLNCADAPVAALQRFIEESVAEYFATLPQSTSPWAPRAPQAWRLHGWAVVLRASGYQIPHFHPEAVVSGVYYVQIPDVVTAGNTGEAGFIKFGPPVAGTSAAQAADRPVARALRPEPGMIVLFPSYYWHHTIPFEGSEDRICVAFDVVADEQARTRGPAREALSQSGLAKS